MNAVPEWFTVEPDDAHQYAVTGTGASSVITGKQLSEGLPVHVEPGKPLRLVVLPKE
jgi:hypothetical protein